MKALHAAGLNAIDEGKYQLAITLFKKAIDEDPTNPDNHYLLGKCHYLCDEYESAIQSLECSIKLIQRQLDDLKKETNDIKKQNVCSQINTKSLELSKNMAYTFDLLAQCYVSQNKEDVALNYYNMAIEIYPNCESAIHNLGLLHMKFAQYNLTINLEDCAVSFGLAEKFIKKALEISSENPLFLQSMASWYEQYIEFLEKVDGDPQQIQQNIIDNFNHALQYYVKALNRCVDNSSLKVILQSNLTECLVQYGHYFYNKKQYEEAKTKYLEALEFDPNHLGAITQMGMSFFKQDCFSKAQHYFSSILEKTDDKQERADAWLNISCTYRMEQDWKNAQIALQHAREFSPDDLEIIEEARKLNQSITNQSTSENILSSSPQGLFSCVPVRENKAFNEQNIQFSQP